MHHVNGRWVFDCQKSHSLSQQLTKPDGAECVVIAATVVSHVLQDEIACVLGLLITAGRC